jgi:glycosyltransferase involved in cell wall biosynthesis
MFAGYPISVVVSERVSIRRPTSHILLAERIHGLLRQVLYPTADSIICVSQQLAEDLERTLLRRPRRVTSIPNPLDARSIRKAALMPIEVPPSLKGGVPTILFVGRLAKQKGVEVLIQAFSELRTRRRCNLVLVGDGPEKSKIVSMIRSLGIESDVVICGSIANPYPWFKIASLLVLPSHYEGFPNVLLEALALELPIVATDCFTGPREILEDGKWGRLVEPNNPEKLAIAMAQTLATRGETRGSTRAGDFEAKSIAAKYLKEILTARGEGHLIKQ